MSEFSRRQSLKLMLAGGAFAPSTARASASDPFDGAAMYREVEEYDALGEHRVSTAVDNATTVWLSRRLAGAGLAVTHQQFPYPFYEPSVCEVAAADRTISLFPAWPPVRTPKEGIKAVLAAENAASVDGRIALVSLVFHPSGGSWQAPGVGELVQGAIDRGARAVIAVTEGPTGGVIALNAAPDTYTWRVPVLLAAGRDQTALRDAAASATSVTLTSYGRLDEDAKADNVIARRRGSGKTLVVTTPKSGWFHCAGERGTGVALFLAAARWLVRETSCDLLFGASSGHEIDYLGSGYFLKTYAPPPDRTRLWLHIGANAAVQATTVDEGGIRFLGTPSPGRLAVSAPSLAAAKRAFSGLPGYDQPILFSEKNAVGELVVFQKGGYTNFAGMIGIWPLFHTREDRAAVATTPVILQETGRALGEFLRSQT